MMKWKMLATTTLIGYCTVLSVHAADVPGSMPMPSQASPQFAPPSGATVPMPNGSVPNQNGNQISPPNSMQPAPLNTPANPTQSGQGTGNMTNMDGTGSVTSSSASPSVNSPGGNVTISDEGGSLRMVPANGTGATTSQAPANKPAQTPQQSTQMPMQNNSQQMQMPSNPNQSMVPAAPMTNSVPQPAKGSMQN